MPYIDPRCPTHTEECSGLLPREIISLDDTYGHRRLVLPDRVTMDGRNDRDAAVAALRHIEAITGTRLRDGGDVRWFRRVFEIWEAQRSCGTASFAEYATRLYTEQVELYPARMPEPASSASKPAMYLSSRDLAEKHGVPYPALDARLRRWRDKGGQFVESADVKRGESKYLYPESPEVMSIVEDLRRAGET